MLPQKMFKFTGSKMLFPRYPQDERKCKWSDPTPLLSLTCHVNGKKGKKGNYKQRTRSVHGLHDSRLSPSPLRNIPSDEEQEESRLYTLAKGHTGI